METLLNPLRLFTDWETILNQVKIQLKISISGRPRSVINKKSIAAVKSIIDRDERVAVNQITK